MSAADNLLTNISKVAYNTVFNAEKIVKTFTGSFIQTTDTTTRSYTLATLPFNVQVYKIAHSFGRPVFTELYWSTDNSYFVVGGAAADSLGNLAISYSDSNFIYIMPVGPISGTVIYYQLVCSWIDDYDTTNPSVAAFSDIPDNYTQVFNSRSVIPAIVKQGTIDSSTSSGILTDVVTSEAHGLAYRPESKTFIESFSGEVWPLNYGGGTNPYEVDDNQVEAQVFVSSTNYTLDMAMKSANGTRRAWYMLYAQQGDDVQTGVYSLSVL